MIARAWDWLFSRCQHEWDTVETQRYDKISTYTDEIVAEGATYVLRCKKCGDVKHKSFWISV